MLLKIHNNLYQYSPEKDSFLSFARETPYQTHSMGSWFRCSEAQDKWLRKEILLGNVEINHKIPGIVKVFV